MYACESVFAFIIIVIKQFVISCLFTRVHVCYLKLGNEKTIEYTFFSLKIINPKNMNKNILEISDQNRSNIEVTLLYFSTNQLKTQNKNILENPAQKLINRKIFRLQNKLVIIWIWLVKKCMSARLNFRTRNKTKKSYFWSTLVTPKSINNEEFN